MVGSPINIIRPYAHLKLMIRFIYLLQIFFCFVIEILRTISKKKGIDHLIVIIRKKTKRSVQAEKKSVPNCFVFVYLRYRYFRILTIFLFIRLTHRLILLNVVLPLIR